MFPKLFLLALVLFSSIAAKAQNIPDNQTAENEEKLRKEAVSFLRETLTDVNGMRSLENRISFTAELAGLMWFHDEREARSMYIGAINDFKDLIVRYESQMNELGPTGDDEQEGYNRFMFDPSDRMRVLRKFSTAMGVRQQIAMSVAEHDPDLAFAFYYDSLSLIGNPDLKKEVEKSATMLESQLIGLLAAKDPDKAAKFARKSIENGLNYQHIDILRKIYEKDPDKGAEFAQAILSRLKSTDKFENLWALSSLVDYGDSQLGESRKLNGKRPVYTEAEMRELVEVLAQAMLSRPATDGSSVGSYLGTVQKYLPGRAAQIRTKFKLTRNSPVANTGTAYEEMQAIQTMAASNSNSNSVNAAAARREAREKEEKQLFDDTLGLTSKQLPKEEREKIIAQARKIIATTPGRDKKIPALSFLAAQVAKLGDKELAAEIMRDAERLVNPAPKNYQDFLLSWMLASGYAAADPEKAFPILEDTIGRANDTLGAFIKVGEFIDVAEEVIQDGELQVGAFGGQMVRGLTSELGMADSTIQVLAKADFAKTRALTNRFDRAEIRILAKMMVLRSVLAPKNAPKVDGSAEPPMDTN